LRDVLAERHARVPPEEVAEFLLPSRTHIAPGRCADVSGSLQIAAQRSVAAAARRAVCCNRSSCVIALQVA
jgi:hypothetical protein